MESETSLRKETTGQINGRWSHRKTYYYIMRDTRSESIDHGEQHHIEKTDLGDQ